ncbi:MAG TPA: S1/P1 nuclease [Candidatus Acidoferrales bacterium]|nr:S1/P1 nuclease [Candidatus Acidoferrales bacterium]
MNGARCALLAIVLLFPMRAWAWGCKGHETIALIAEKHLTPHARAIADQILRDSPIDPSLPRYCKNTGLDAFTDSSTWADDYRSQRPKTGDWHFIDIPRGAAQGEIEKYCRSDDCVTSAIRDQMGLLRTADSPKQRADALRFIIHLVGDLHQPLHTTTNNDRGGNCVPLSFFGQSPQLTNAQNETYAPNLHSIWDFGILERMTDGETVAQFAEELDGEFRGRMAPWQQEGIRLDDWAWESHEAAERTAYGDLPRKIPIETPRAGDSCAGDNHIGTRMLSLHERVAGDYQNAAASVIREQLAKASVRLAMILNSIWR